MSVSKKLGETFMKGEDIKKATRLPDWFLRLKGKWDARNGPDVPNAYLRKLHEKISSLDNAEVNTAENILIPSRDSAAVALNKLSDSKRTVSSTPVPQSDGSPKSVRAQRRSNGTVSSARASAQSSANALYSANEFMPAEELDDIGSGYYTFNEDTIKFLPDSCTFINEAAAISALSAVAKELSSNPSVNITIAGTIASVGNGTGISLSNSRADAVKRILVSEYGVEENRISTVGLGKIECFLREDDLNSDGSLNEEAAAKNRAIHIYDSNSETAENINKLLVI